MIRILALSTAAAAMLSAAPALAEVELSFYSGWQDSPHSRVEGSDPGGLGDFSFLADWEGKSLAMPPYYGLRATWWRSERLGFGVEFTHAKVYGSDETLADNNLETLEMTDGINIVTANVLYRWTGPSRFTPYAGGGIGFNVPHVEFTSAGGETFDYKFGGLSVALVGGVSYALSDRWALFGEYRGTYNQVDVDLDNGGSLKTDIITNSVNLGVSFRF